MAKLKSRRLSKMQEKPLRITNILDNLNICTYQPAVRKQFYSFLQKLNITDEGKNPTQIALNLGLASVVLKVPDYYSWNIRFIYNKLQEHGFETGGRFLCAIREYDENTFFSKRQLQNANYMCEKITTQEFNTIVDDYVDGYGKPTEETIKENIAKINSGFPICTWDTASIEKTFRFFTDNKKNNNLQDLTDYINNNH